MKKTTIGVLVLLFLAVAAAHAYSRELYADRIAAVVNGDVILESEIKKSLQPQMRSMFTAQLGVVPPGKVPTEKEILDELIVLRLLEQEAAKKGYQIDDKQVDLSIDSLRKRYNLTPEQFLRYLLERGVNYEEYRKIHRREIMLTKLIQSEVMQKMPLSEQDAQVYFKKHANQIPELHQKLLESLNPAPPPQEEPKIEIPTHEEVYVGGKIRLRQITLTVPPNASRAEMEKLVAKAKEIYKDALTGAEFEQLAKKYSQDPLASKGGDLGLMDYKDLVPAIQQVVRKMKEGDITQPLPTPRAIFLFNLVEAKGRQLKKIPIPENIRKQYEKQFKEAYERQKLAAQRKKPQSPSEKDSAEDGEEVDIDSTTAKKTNPGVLSSDEEKEYRKVRRKVHDIVRQEKFQARMKEWLENLKKNSIIEVKL